MHTIIWQFCHITVHQVLGQTIHLIKQLLSLLQLSSIGKMSLPFLIPNTLEILDLDLDEVTLLLVSLQLIHNECVTNRSVKLFLVYRYIVTALLYVHEVSGSFNMSRQEDLSAVAIIQCSGKVGLASISLLLVKCGCATTISLCHFHNNSSAGTALISSFQTAVNLRKRLKWYKALWAN